MINSRSADLTTDPAIVELVNRYERQIVWRPQSGGPVEANAVPDAVERRTLNIRLDLLKQALRPASLAMTDRKRIGSAVSAMLAGGYSSLKNTDPQSIIATYVLELSGKPAWAVEKACLAVRAGEVEGLNPDYPPTTARLNQLADAELVPAKLERGKIGALLGVVLAPSRRSQAEQDVAQESARAWLDRTDERAKQIAAVNRPSTEAELERRAFTEAANREFFLRECERDGVDPARGVSPSLLKMLEENKNV